MHILGGVPISQVFQYASAAPAPGLPDGLSAIAWVDMSQQSGSDGVSQTTLQDNAVPARTYSGGNRTYRANRRNGLPTLAASTSGSSIYTASSQIAIASNAPCLFWGVLQTAGSDGYLWASTSNQFLRLNYGGSGSGYPMALYTGVGPVATSNPLSAAEATSWGTYFIHRNTANEMRFYYSGLPKFTPGDLWVISGSLSLTYLLGNLFGFDAEFAEAGVSDIDPTLAQLNALGQSLRDKWAVSWTDI